MSKSKGNVINPDDYVSELGADTVRAYLMFIGPWDQGGGWDDSGINGISRWLNRIWNLVLGEETTLLSDEANDEQAVKELRHITHKTIKKVTEDLEKFHFNTMLASLMEFTNHLAKVWEAKSVNALAWKEAIDTLLLLLAPTAPHFTEELWAMTGHSYSIHNHTFPVWEEELVAEEQITLVIQVNGKLRDKVLVPASIAEVEAQELALSQPKIQDYLKDKKLAKVIYVPPGLVNLVVQ